MFVSLKKIFFSLFPIELEIKFFYLFLGMKLHVNIWCSEGSFTCHIYCDTALPFIIFISEDPWHSHLLPSVWQWSRHHPSLRLQIVPPSDRTPISRMRGERSTTTPPRQYFSIWIIQCVQKICNEKKTLHFYSNRCKINYWLFFSNVRIFSRNFQNLQFLSIKLVGSVCVQYILFSRCLAFLLR